MESMQVDDSTRYIACGTSPTVTALLHPLVVLNISEHWTRVRAQKGSDKQVAGALIGKLKEDRVIEIMNSFELVLTGNLSVDMNLYYQKDEQFKQVFPDTVFLGWYTTGPAAPNKSDLMNHKLMLVIDENCLLLKLDPYGCHKDLLPITLYESVIQELDVSGEPNILFVQVDYTLAAEEAERIGVNHVAEVENSESNEGSAVAEVLTMQYNAIEMLYKRVKMLLEYVKAVQNKELPEDQHILREILALSHRLPVMQSSVKFDEEFYAQSNDVALIAYLGSMTKTCNDLVRFLNKFNIMNGKPLLGSPPLEISARLGSLKHCLAWRRL